MDINKKLNDGDFFICSATYNETDLVVKLPGDKPTRVSLEFFVLHGKITQVCISVVPWRRSLTNKEEEIIQKNIKPYLDIIRNPGREYFDRVFPSGGDAKSIASLVKLL